MLGVGKGFHETGPYRPTSVVGVIKVLTQNKGTPSLTGHVLAQTILCLVLSLSFISSIVRALFRAYW